MIYGDSTVMCIATVVIVIAVHTGVLNSVGEYTDVTFIVSNFHLIGVMQAGFVFDIDANQTEYDAIVLFRALRDFKQYPNMMHFVS